MVLGVSLSILFSMGISYTMATHNYFFCHGILPFGKVTVERYFDICFTLKRK